MQIQVNDITLCYKRSQTPLDGKNNIPTVILLHGWGGSMDSLNGLYNALQRRGADVIAVDLPGFGGSGIRGDFTLFDYADCIRSLMEQLKLDKVTIVGHSFGGKIALTLASDPKIKQLVLVDASGLKPRFSLKKYLAIRRYKRAKRKGRDLSCFGSPDYLAAGGDMRSVFVRVVNTHLDGILKEINKPVLLLWGKDDADTPPYMAKRLLKKVRGSGIVWLTGGHFAYLSEANKFCAAVEHFVFAV